MATEFKDVEARLWKVADTLRANSGLKASEYSTPVLGLIFLKYADQRFREAQTRLETQYPGEDFTRDDFQAEGVLYLRDSARFDALLHLPESADIGQAVNDAMRVIEEDNEDLRGNLPKDYRRIQNSALVSLLRAFDGGEVWKGDLLFMSAALCWSCYSVLARHHRLDAVRASTL